MPTGTVKWFDATRGYGFITPERGGQDVFVHVRAVERAGIREIKQGQRLSYEPTLDRKSNRMSAEELKLA